MKKAHISQPIQVFRDLVAPEKGLLAGYGALIDRFDLQIPLPHKLSLISTKTRRYNTDKWEVFTPRHTPADNLLGHLIFALKYEGLNLGFFKSLFSSIDSVAITKIIKKEPHSQYSRKIWFLYEWLMDKKLAVPDLENRSYIDLLDEKQQYSGKAINSSRHRVRNNLPGTKEFCPLIRKTPKLEAFIAQNLAARSQRSLETVAKDILKRASAFLLLKDSRSSFAIENKYPSDDRLRRWGKVIGQAGTKPLTKEELLNLQEMIVQDSRFIKLGWRTQGGFVGIHDRSHNTPIPDHISARWEDIDSLISGLINTFHHLLESEFDPVLVATIIAFGFVFIHPLEDGNGRIHRYLVHHVLVAMSFTDKSLVFPISAAILDKIDHYQEVLESYSAPLLDLIKWQSTPKHNIEVLSETIDYYRYFDVTAQAEFFYECVQQTIDTIIPAEIEYLKKYDQFKEKIKNKFDMTEKTISLLIKFLAQSNGRFSQRAKVKEFAVLSDVEIKQIEKFYQEVF